MTLLPSFRIEGVKGVWRVDDLDNIDDLSAEEYDACIKVAPEAKLKYLDEEEDEVIVGSSGELLDRINELGPEVPIVLQTVTERGQDYWVAFMLERSTRKTEEPQQERQRTSEEIEHTLFECFQRDLEQALKESLTLQQHAEASSSSSSSETPSDQPRSNPSVETFLRTLTETVQNTLSQVYPHAQNVTAKLRENAALRQAAEVLQKVGHTANQAINNPDKKKVAEDVRDEVKVAMRNVGTALGEAFAEIGEAYVQVYKEINKEVQEIIQRTRGGSGASTPEKPEAEQSQTASKVNSESSEATSTESSSPKRDLKPTVEDEPEQVDEREPKTDKLMEETSDSDSETDAPRTEDEKDAAHLAARTCVHCGAVLSKKYDMPRHIRDAHPEHATVPPSVLQCGFCNKLFECEDRYQKHMTSPSTKCQALRPSQHAESFSFNDGQLQYSYQQQSQSLPGETELERALRRAEAHRLERERISPPMPGTFNLSEPLTARNPFFVKGTPPPVMNPAQPRPFGNLTRFGSFAGGGSSGFARPHGRGRQLLMGPNGFQRQPTEPQAMEPENLGQESSGEEIEREHERFARELEQGLRDLEIQKEEEEKAVHDNQAKVDECVAKLIDMGYDEVFDAERVKAVAVVAEGEVETAIALLTEGHD